MKLRQVGELSLCLLVAHVRKCARNDDSGNDESDAKQDAKRTEYAREGNAPSARRRVGPKRAGDAQKNRNGQGGKRQAYGGAQQQGAKRRGNAAERQGQQL